ncbi:rhodanese-like domain-containing protein [Sulfurimonas paralvinellae]|uniref:Rhodanese-like domain-containing protein n=1 Tax=Sulfurimonas paralvinellae TaxID=317658 RepID=A0A7M1B7W0_9BACT|nr:rhodanese-like domain-containing protein [Sulfurimonas paralvinellae]QOP45813.1 rhodanese-like domain-containing protein [Sulfurimonas paralvinellae]
MQELARKIVPSEMSNMRIEIEDFVSLYNEGKCELVDVRVPFETAVWQVNFGLKIPANELPERLNELPKDKLIVVACPKTDRSNMARIYLASEGFEVKYLVGGLLGLMDALKGGKAKKINL